MTAPIPPPLKLSFTNLFKVFNLISPMMILMLIFFITIINESYFGLLTYLGILSISIIIIRILQQLFNSSIDLTDDQQIYCNFWGLDSIGGIPISSSSNFGIHIPYFILSFTLFYVLYCMNGSNNYNWGLLIFLIVLNVLHILNSILFCVPSNYIFKFLILTGFTLLVANLFTFFMNFIARSSENSKFVFFGKKLSNNQQCSKPSSQTFKCSVYKNGKLLKTL